jgi:hypothetical protein
MGLWSSFLDKIFIPNVETVDVFIINFVFAIILFGLGILLGRFVTRLLKRSVEKSRIESTIRKSFVELFITVIRWSIYIVFINFALAQLHIPQLTDWLISTLVVIPALTGSLLLIGIGFAVATYLKEIIKESKIEGHELLSTIFYYFVIYIFLVFAIKTAFIRQDKTVVNTIVLIFTGVISAAVAYMHVKSKKTIR